MQEIIFFVVKNDLKLSELQIIKVKAILRKNLIKIKKISDLSYNLYNRIVSLKFSNFSVLSDIKILQYFLNF